MVVGAVDECGALVGDGNRFFEAEGGAVEERPDFGNLARIQIMKGRIHEVRIVGLQNVACAHAVAAVGRHGGSHVVGGVHLVNRRVVVALQLDNLYFLYGFTGGQFDAAFTRVGVRFVVFYSQHERSPGFFSDFEPGRLRNDVPFSRGFDLDGEGSVVLCMEGAQGGVHPYILELLLLNVAACCNCRCCGQYK